MVRIHSLLQTLPPGVKPPEWINPDEVNAAYDYFKYVNRGLPPLKWRPLTADDPGRQFLQGIPVPPSMMMSNREMILPDVALQLTEREDPLLTQLQAIQDRQVPRDQWPAWMKVAADVMSSPIPSALMTGLAGFGIGSVAGPAGAGIGAVGGLAVGYRAATNPEGSAADLLYKLNIPVEMVEQGFGAWLQLAGAYLGQVDPNGNPNITGTPEEVIAGLPKNYFQRIGDPRQWPALYEESKTSPTLQAAGLTFDIGAKSIGNFGQWVDNFKKYYGQDMFDSLPQARALTIIRALFDKRLSEGFAGPGQVWQIGVPIPVDLETPDGLAAITDVRRRILRGEDPEQIIAEYSIRYGFSGQFANLVGQAAADPLNHTGWAAARSAAGVANVFDNPALAESFRASARHGGGLYDGFKIYKNALRTGGSVGGVAVPTPAEFGGFENWLAGVSENFIFKELDPSYRPPGADSLVGRSYATLAGLTPEARAKVFAGMAHENYSVLLNELRNDPAALLAKYREIASVPPRQAGDIAAAAGAPELYTVRQASAEALPALETLDALYQQAEPIRRELYVMAEMVGMTPDQFKTAAASAETAPTLFNRLAAAAEESNVNGADMVRAGLESGNITADSLSAHFRIFGEDSPVPLTPAEYYSTFMATVAEVHAQWADTAFGVKPEAGVYRISNLNKKVTSLALLGFSPTYLVGNVMTDIVNHGFELGLTGLDTRTTIDNFNTRFGVEPFFSATAQGAAEAAPTIGGQATTAAVGTPAEVAARTRKIVSDEIRSATRHPETFLSRVERALDAANQKGPFTWLTGLIEAGEARRAQYGGTRQWWDREWQVGRGIDPMDPDLRQAIDLEGGPGMGPQLDGILEGALNAQEAREQIYNREDVGYNLDAYIRETAQASGDDPAEIKNTLTTLGVYDMLKERMAGGVKTQSEKVQLQRDVLAQIDSHLDAISRRELGTRVEDLANQVGASGFAQGVRIYDDLQFYQLEMWHRHFAEWERLFKNTADLDPMVRGPLIEAQRATSNAEWTRTQQFEEASYVGMLKALGADDPKSQTFMNGLRDRHQAWRDFYTLRDGSYAEFFGREFDTPLERTNAWRNLQDAMDRAYTEAAVKEARANIKLDNNLADLFSRRYGKDIGDLVTEWRKGQADFNRERVAMMREFRRTLITKDAGEARAAWSKFLQQDYLTLIRNHYIDQSAWAHDIHQALLGKLDVVRSRRGLQPVAPAEAAAAPAQIPIEQAPKQEAIIEKPLASVNADRRAQIYDVAEKAGMTVRRDANGHALPGTESLIRQIVLEFGTDDVHRLYTDKTPLADMRPDLVQYAFENKARVDAMTRQMEADAAAAFAEAGDRAPDVTPEFSPEQAAAMAESAKVSAMRTTWMDTPRHQLEPIMSEAIGNEARNLRTELGGGEFVGMIKTTDELAGAGGASGDQHIRMTRATSNADWYRQLNEEGFNRHTVENAIERIIQDDGADREGLKAVARVKQVILDRMMGRSDDLMAGLAHPAPFALLGDVEGAAQALAPYLYDGIYAPEELLPVKRDVMSQIVDRALEINGERIATEEGRPPLPDGYSAEDALAGRDPAGLPETIRKAEIAELRSFRQQIYDQWVEAQPNLTADQAAAQFALMDQRADNWARGMQAQGIEASPLEWYRNRFEQVRAGDESKLGQALMQNPSAYPGWYSALERKVEGLPQETMTVQQLQAAIGKGGVKADELKWTGFDEWLAGKQPGDKITKAEAQAFLRKNRVELVEVVKGDLQVAERAANKGIQELDALRPQIMAAVEDYTTDLSTSERGGMTARNVDQLFFDIRNGNIDPQTLDGDGLATDYDIATEDLQKALGEDLYGKLLRLTERQFDASMASASRETKYDMYTLPGGENYRELLLTLPDEATKQFRSSHFDEPNIVAHTRYKERVDVNGRRLTFLEEVQSDWHEQGRREGYIPQIDMVRRAELQANYDRLTVEYEKNVNDLRAAEGTPEYEQAWANSRRITAERNAAYSALADFDRQANRAVPDAPYKNTWPDLMLRRMLMEAASQGKDGLAWTTGATQNERYNLSNFYDELVIRQTEADAGGGFYTLQGVQMRAQGDYGGSVPRTLAEGLTRDELPSYVGQELAQKAIRAFDDGENVFVASGDNLEVGGEGMRTFYDEFLVRKANELGKKFGVQVERTQVTVDLGIEEYYNDAWVLPINDEMRASLKESGMPLFQGHRGAIQFTSEGKAIVEFFKRSDFTTGVHEFGHILRRELDPVELDVVAQYGGLKDGAELGRLEAEFQADTISEANRKRYVKAEEDFARGLERYLAGDHVGLSEQLAAVFEKIRAYMLEVYKRLTNAHLDIDIDVKIQTERGPMSLRDIFDRLLLDEQSIIQRQALAAAQQEAAASVSAWGEQLADGLFQSDQQGPIGSDPTGLFQGGAEPPDEVPPIGPLPLGSVEGVGAPRYSGMQENQLNGDVVRPLIDDLFSRYLADNPTGSVKIGVDGLTPETRRRFDAYINKQLDQNMPSSKLAALRWGENVRDKVLLPYHRRYGADNLINTIYPYAFYYLRSTVDWMFRSIDHPAVLSQWARWREFQRNSLWADIPQRMRDRVRIPAPWLPEWAGDGVYIDPLNYHPVEQLFANPVDRFMQDSYGINKAAEKIIEAMRESGQVEASLATEALAKREGALWNEALRLAEEQEGKQTGALGFTQVLLQKGLPWQLLENALKDTPEKNSVLPITRTGQTLETLYGKASFPLNLLGAAGRLMSAPEEYIRDHYGLSEFGEWGPYYIDRELANMAAEGDYPIEEVLAAMYNQSGPIYLEAQSRVQLENALRTPGSLPVMALQNESAPGDVIAATLFGWLPGGLLPASELQYRGIKKEYDAAWTAYNNGNKSALDSFWDKYPEYEARLALWKEPEERLRQFMVNRIWDAYFEQASPNRPVIANQLGDEFKQSFLNSDTRSYESIDLQTLALWSQRLSIPVPSANLLPPENLGSMLGQAGLLPTAVNLIPQDQAAAVEQYRSDRDQNFPNWYALQTQYYSLQSRGEQQQFLQEFPQLADYWEANRAFKADHPELLPYLENFQYQQWHIDNGRPYYSIEADGLNAYLRDFWRWRDEDSRSGSRPRSTGGGGSGRHLAPLSYPDGISRPLRNKLIQYYAKGRRGRLNPQARSNLYNVWRSSGYPGGDFDTWVDVILRRTFQRAGMSVTDQRQAEAPQRPAMPTEINGSLGRKLMGYYYSDEPLGSGARRRLRQIWERNGRPGGDFETYINTVLRKYFQQ